ncbi:MAG TPA: thiamine ABC transporter substrate binding subunit [Hypericibacter adhaerens]|uniref:Thiamine transporter substrate binding subunit n=1 Tax=Hypericibacter adhaerens TaxID=2602016 RepID=A0A5J6MWF4_9PROT|nr:thiamine ABC transporter substrate binding subunit [Hypericibacter adhaerens]QEX22042.1 thiamine transporter substrate binding subunit [Hypericibacter adhaerens]HWA46300.1 thiamine ABC transporter substrate binding subunit [Hypericibacter adhaerens]
MRHFKSFAVLAAISIGLGLGALGTAAADTPTLRILTYESFTSEWGLGTAIKPAFEKECGCKLEFISVEDGAALLSRLKLEGASSKADIVLGLDTNLTAETAATGLIADHGLDLSRLDLPMAWADKQFVPFDYGWFAFVYDKTRLPNPPQSLADLAKGDAKDKIVIEDPRTSTPGLGLLMWVRKVYGDKAPDYWASLKPRILTVTKGWSEAYDMFLKGEAALVLSYTTSPSYHLIEEKKDQYAAGDFAEGNYLQIEVAAKLAHAPQPALADKFLAFMLSPGFQSAVATTNWMYPAKTPAEGLPAGFAAPLPKDKTLLFTPEEAGQGRRAWVDEWLKAMSR